MTTSTRSDATRQQLYAALDLLDDTLDLLHEWMPEDQGDDADYQELVNRYEERRDAIVGARRHANNPDDV
jgi:hypothetical protein